MIKGVDDYMDIENQSLLEEKRYLDNILSYIRNELQKNTQLLLDRKTELLKSRKAMWENTVHYSDDFERLTEISQYLSELRSQTESYGSVFKQVEKYKKMLDIPYFGRFDFVEEGSDEDEKLYIGLHNVIDSESFNIIIYDWRSPIASIFYQYELGDVTYKSPSGPVSGNVLLKRQYKIKSGQLEYFFDSNVRINDEMLQDTLCFNSSTKMRNIVETIQKEQDAIIRDTNNGVLVVQGVAGSGKTSIALHRIAYLLYHGMSSKLNSNNILIISPNSIFSKYISNVLPELGESNVAETTFDDLAIKIIDSELQIERKNTQLESLINNTDEEEMRLRSSSIAFKESRVFVEILNRLLTYYEKNMIEFEDVYYDGSIIETKQILRNQFLRNEIGRPITKRLKRMEKKLFSMIHPIRKERIKRIEKLVEDKGEHKFQIRCFSRLLSIKESKVLRSKIRKFTEIDFLHVYKYLFSQEGLLLKLAQGLKLSDCINQIIEITRRDLEKGVVCYEDTAPLIFLRLKIEGNDLFSEIKQVVIDEAQDYSPMQYEVFNLLFDKGKFTILGDVNQSICKNPNESLYDDIIEIIKRKNAIKLNLDKSYRSSYEITSFAKKILNLSQEITNFERHDTKPTVELKDSFERIDKAIYDNIKKLMKEGYTSIAVICKTAIEAKGVYEKLRNLDVKLIDSEEKMIEKGVLIIPVYMSKGLEFDAVVIYNASRESYSNEMDRNLLYIACTRALHRLNLYYTGEISPFITF